MNDLTDISKEIAARLRPMLEDLERISNRRESKQAKEKPKEHRLTRVFEKPLSYRYYRGKRRTIFCYSVHRNVAGYFLIWRQRESAKGLVTRDQWDATIDKRDAISTCRQRAKA